MIAVNAFGQIMGSTLFGRNSQTSGSDASSAQPDALTADTEIKRESAQGQGHGNAGAEAGERSLDNPSAMQQRTANRQEIDPETGYPVIRVEGVRPSVGTKPNNGHLMAALLSANPQISGAAEQALNTQKTIEQIEQINAQNDVRQRQAGLVKTIHDRQMDRLAMHRELDQIQIDAAARTAGHTPSVGTDFSSEIRAADEYVEHMKNWRRANGINPDAAEGTWVDGVKGFFARTGEMAGNWFVEGAHNAGRDILVSRMNDPRAMMAMGRTDLVTRSDFADYEPFRFAPQTTQMGQLLYNEAPTIWQGIDYASMAIGGLKVLTSPAILRRVGGGSNSGLTELNPRSIRFSQTTVKKQGATLPDLVESMRRDGFVVQPDRLVDVVRMPDGQLTTLDNTRVLAAERAGVNIQARVHNFDDPLPNDPNFIFRFLGRNDEVPRTFGDAVNNRIGRQHGVFEQTYPFGSPYTGTRF